MNQTEDMTEINNLMPKLIVSDSIYQQPSKRRMIAHPSDYSTGTIFVFFFKIFLLVISMSRELLIEGDFPIRAPVSEHQFRGLLYNNVKRDGHKGQQEAAHCTTGQAESHREHKN